MTEKFVSHGNTYDGDGTTKDAAASAGATGAWNDLLAIMTAAPTYGSLVAGDIVNIRSQISSVDVTIVVVDGADVTMLSRGNIDDGPVTWLADDGTIWTGDDGTLTLQVHTVHKLTTGTYNKFKGVDQNFVFVATSGGAVNHMWLSIQDHILFDDCVLESEYSTTHYSRINVEDLKRVAFIDCLLYERAWVGGRFIKGNIYGATVYFVNCEFKTDFNTVTGNMIAPGGLSARTRVIGGKTTNMHVDRTLFGMGGTTYHGLTNLTVVGFDCNCVLRSAPANDATYRGVSICADMGINAFDYELKNQAGRTEWIRGDLFPYLNATLPDTTPYSFRILPGSTVSTFPTNPYSAAEMMKYFDDTSAAKKITLELLIDSALTTPMCGEYKIEVGYLSTDDEYKVEHSTIDWLTGLTASTASWNTTTYKTRAHSKYKIELTTANAIKQYSNVTVRFLVGKGSSAAYYVFIDPDFTVGAP